MLSVMAATYAAVFVAEIAGDKLLYTTGVLATRYRPLPVILGATLAFMAKMAAAVILGNSIASLSLPIVSAISALSFFTIAYSLWSRPPEGSIHETSKDRPQAAAASAVSTVRGALTTFAAVFFSEWGDVGQVTAATLAARTGAPIAVWFAAVAAMLTKAMLAASVGTWIRVRIGDYMSASTVRYCGVAILAFFGILSVTLR
jgi:putative Ca2+/H+ antiporter (TMEM165/GDT1 family)